jgi:hypothetical protein
MTGVARGIAQFNFLNQQLRKIGHAEAGTAVYQLMETFDFRSLQRVPRPEEDGDVLSEDEANIESSSDAEQDIPVPLHNPNTLLCALPEPDEREGEEGELAREAEALAWRVRKKLRLDTATK